MKISGCPCYDLIIVGSGLYGAVVARLAYERGKRVLVLERRKVVGGNCHDEWTDSICVHQHGAHIFHTDDEAVWRFVNRFTRLNGYMHEVFTRSEGQLIRLPLSLGTFYDVFGITEPWQIDEMLNDEHKTEYYDNPKNLEEQAVNIIGRTLYEKVIKGYTEKQWGRNCKELPASLILRLPVRQTFNNRYFNDPYQGIPEEGYTRMTEKMLEGIEVRTGVDFCKERNYWLRQSYRVIYMGMVDELQDYCYGPLSYRSLRFEHERVNRPLFQGCAVINEAAPEVPYTRTIEHKHFLFDTQTSHTIITREFPQEWQPGCEAYYPLHNDESQRLYQRYTERLRSVYPTIELGGRLGLYQYLDMDETILKAFFHMGNTY